MNAKIRRRNLLFSLISGVVITLYIYTEILITEFVFCDFRISAIRYSCSLITSTKSLQHFHIILHTSAGLQTKSLRYVGLTILLLVLLTTCTSLFAWCTPVVAIVTSSSLLDMISPVFDELSSGGPCKITLSSR